MIDNGQLDFLCVHTWGKCQNRPFNTRVTKNCCNFLCISLPCIFCTNMMVKIVRKCLETILTNLTIKKDIDILFTEVKVVIAHCIVQASLVCFDAKQ